MSDKLFVIFDLDGTLANIDHRLHYLDHNDWNSFFEACDKDEPVLDVINVLKAFVEAGHHVEIWSGRSAQVEEKTKAWLDKYIGENRYHAPRSWENSAFDQFQNLIYNYPSDLLTHMRAENDFRADYIIKEEWLHAFHQKHGKFPDMIFDDRQQVVDMWRRNGVTCAQVADWKDRKKVIQPHPMNTHLLHLLVGPSGAGKSTYAKEHYHPSQVISSDFIREELCNDFKDQSRNDEVFQAVHALVKTRLESGLLTVVDATNIRNKDRKEFIKIAAEVDPNIKIQYIVIDRTLEEKLETGGWRNNVFIKRMGSDTINLVEKHHMTMQSNIKDILNGDGFFNVTVIDERKK